MHKRALAGEIPSAEEADRLVATHLRTPYAYPKLREQLEAAARRAIEGYIRENADELRRLEFSEKGIEISLGDGVSVAGRIDLVRRTDTDEVTIVDLKSNERAQTNEATEAQLHIYALGYQTLTGRNADYVEIYELDKQNRKVRSVQEEFLEEVQRNVRRAANALRKNALEPAPRKKTCQACDYCNLCTSAISA